MAPLQPPRPVRRSDYWPVNKLDWQDTTWVTHKASRWAAWFAGYRTAHPDGEVEVFELFRVSARNRGARPSTRFPLSLFSIFREFSFATPDSEH